MARRIWVGLIAAAATFATLPCVAGSKAISLEDLAAFKVGSATYGDVVHTLGKPRSETFDSAGIHSIAYETTRSRAKAASFIPYAGIFLGGAKGTATMVVLSFAPDGRLLQYQSSSATVDCSAAIFGANCKGGMFIPPPALTYTPPAGQVPAAAPPVSTPAAAEAPRATAAAKEPPRCGMVPQRSGAVLLVPC